MLKTLEGLHILVKEQQILTQDADNPNLYKIGVIINDEEIYSETTRFKKQEIKNKEKVFSTKNSFYLKALDELLNKIKLNEFKTLRNKLQLSQEALGQELNIPRRTIADWEREIRRPPTWTWDLLIEKLKRMLDEKSG